MRRLTCFIIVFLFLLPVAAQEFAAGDLNFESGDNGRCVLVASPGASGKVVIPPTVSYENNTYSVTAIAASAFENNTGITALQLPEGLVEIGEKALKGCRALEVVGLPVSLTALGAEAFAECKALGRIEVPDVTETIGRKAFWGCTSLGTVVLGEKLKRIDTQAFDECTALSRLHIRAAEPPSLGAYVFVNHVYEVAEMTVPVGRRGAYAASSLWGRFRHIAERDAFGDNVTLTLRLPSGCVSTEETFGLSVTLELKPDNGWRVFSVLFNGAPLKTDDKRVTLPALTEDSTIQVIFADASGVELPDIADLRIRVSGGAIIVDGVPEGEVVEVFSPEGVLFYSGSDRMIYPGFSGTAILKIKSRTFKLCI